MTTYTPKTWQTDDPITDVDLNRMEERIAEFQQLERVWMVIINSSSTVLTKEVK